MTSTASPFRNPNRIAKNKYSMISKFLKNRSWLECSFAVLATVLLQARIRWFLTPDKAFQFEEPSLTADESLSSPRIPKIIHQSYKTSKLPIEWESTPSRWKELNPDFEYKFWSDEDNRKLIETDYPWFLETYDSYPFPIQRADSARYFAVLKYGGIYADLDILPRRKVSPLLDWLSSKEHKDKELLVAETYNLGLTNALFAAVPDSKVLDKFVHTLPDEQHPFGGFEYLIPHFGILLSTGPTRFWIFLNNYRDKVVTLAPSGWGQCHQCRMKPGQCEAQPTSYFETTRGGSWHHWDTLIFNFIFCFPEFMIWLGFGALVVVGRCLYSRWYKRQQPQLPSQEMLPMIKTGATKLKTHVKENSRSSLCCARVARYELTPSGFVRLARQTLQRQEVVLYLAVLVALRAI